jgi:hypothetical protein
MKRALILLFLFAPAAITGISIWAVRSTRAAAAHVQSDTRASSHLVIPKGTNIRVKLMQSISHATKPGVLIQAVTDEPVFIGGQLAIPANTRAALHIGDIQKPHDGLAEATVQLRELNFSDQTVAVHTEPVVATLPRESDLDLMSRAAGGMLGGAVGAAGGAAVRGDPRAGAGTVAGLAAGQEGGESSSGLLHFQLVEPVDLTGIRW